MLKPSIPGRATSEAFESILNHRQRSERERDQAWAAASMALTTVLFLHPEDRDIAKKSIPWSRAEDGALMTKIVFRSLQNESLYRSVGRACEVGQLSDFFLHLVWTLGLEGSTRLNYLLSLAINDNSRNIVEECLRSGADKDKGGEHFLTPIEFAAYAGRHEITSALLGVGVNTNINHNSLGNRGYSALGMAIVQGHTEIVELLLSHRADLDCIFCKDNDIYLTPLEAAIECIERTAIFPDVEFQGHTPTLRPEMIKLLAWHCQDVNKTSKDMPILIQFLVKWREERRRLLREEGNLIQNEEAWCECLSCLLKSGADVRKVYVDNDGPLSCFEVAHQVNSFKAQQLLFQWSPSNGQEYVQIRNEVARQQEEKTRKSQN